MREYTPFFDQNIFFCLCLSSYEKKANSQNIMNKKTVLKPQQQQQSLGAERKKTRAINTKMETEVV